MLHLVARTYDGASIADGHDEAAALWGRLIAALPGVMALYLMPNHIHALVPTDARVPLAGALGAFARWRGHRRGLASARLWARMPEPVFVPPGQKVRRVERYISLNGCRAGLDLDPLEAVWSTHRDAVGLVARPVRALAADPVAHHAYISADAAVTPAGTSLPLAVDAGWHTERDALRLIAVVSAITRTPVASLSKRGPARALLVRSARLYSRFSTGEIGEIAGVTRRAVQLVEPREDAATRVVLRVFGDERFRALEGPVWRVKRRRSW